MTPPALSWLIIFAVAVLAMLAGCADKAPPAPSTTATGTSQAHTGSTTSTTTTPTIETPSSGIPNSISWNKCRGTGASIPYGNTLLAIDEGETPPGWERGPTGNSLYTFIMSTCERISVGGYERGPASFLLDMHWGVDPPDSCREFEPGFDQAVILLSIWVDDPEVAALLRDRLEMPVILGEITSETTPQGEAEIQAWTWEADGAETSTITVAHPGGSETQGAPVDRLIWHNGTGVRFLDLAQDTLLPDAPFPTAQGILAPPMRYAKTGPTPFVGPAAVWKTGDFYGPIYRFGDMECKQPLG